MSKAGIPITHYKINSISPIYTYYNQFFTPKSEEEYNKLELKYGNIDKYRLISIIGSGKYSLVFVGHCVRGFCAIKVLKNVNFQKIQKEIYIINRIAGSSSVVQLYDVIKDQLTDTISIVTNYFHSESHKTLYPRLSIDDIRYYLLLILQNIDYCHSKGVMHRDIKPGNVLINHREQTICIIDWGLADLYYPYKQYSVRVSTMRYKAPELLLNYHFYDYGIDIWGVGCIMAEMLFGFNFIEGSTYEEVFESIIKLWGKKVFLNYIDKYGMEVPETFFPIIDKYEIPEWPKRISSLRKHMKDEDAIDLIKKLLEVDHGERITARNALEHPFFYPLFCD
ncbi:hypothetical protein M9Y10_037862 [Tritrichomonas musculus]|uniref:non-specific serine/threonine protein kinase n=1 Tax=Tritrichomonas musculus TaxID=1915356 RepID=A0ABR2K6T3_9EUKA